MSAFPQCEGLYLAALIDIIRHALICTTAVESGTANWYLIDWQFGILYGST